MDTIDLEIDNYSLDDILNLFKISDNFGEVELKNAKRMVLMTHPDKSKLEKEVFFFFSKAYKYLYFINEFRHRNDKTIREDLDGDDAHQEIIMKIREKKDFHKVFNELFEEHKMKSEFTEKGYQEWMSSDDDLNTNNKSVHNMTDMKNAFYEEKKKKKDLIKYTGVQEVHDMTHSELSGNAPEHYGSTMFSKLQYEDLKVAHTENIIPVSELDFDPSKQFKSITQLQKFRSSQSITPLSDAQATQYLQHKKEMETKESTRRAFTLAKQMEEAREKSEQFLAKFKYLQ